MNKELVVNKMTKDETIRTDEEFKVALFQCIMYMTNVGKSDKVEMDITTDSGSIKVKLELA